MIYNGFRRIALAHSLLPAAQDGAQAEGSDERSSAPAPAPAPADPTHALPATETLEPA